MPPFFHVLALGAAFLIPAWALAASPTYIVARGDTPVKIAERLGLDTTALLAANPGLDPRRLLIGQVIVLPDQARKTAPSDAPASSVPSPPPEAPGRTVPAAPEAGAGTNGSNGSPAPAGPTASTDSSNSTGSSIPHDPTGPTAATMPTGPAAAGAPTASEYPAIRDGRDEATAAPDQPEKTTPALTASPAGPAAVPPPGPSPATAGIVPDDSAHGGARDYVIAQGDTPAELARRFGVSVEALLAANGHPDPTRLAVGTVLTIPPPGPGSAAPLAPGAGPAPLVMDFQ